MVAAIVETKAELRRRVRTSRRDFLTELDPLERDGAFLTLPRSLWPLFADARIVGLYDATEQEAPTLALLHFVTDSRREAALPVVRDGTMTFRSTASSLAVKPDLLFVPLVAFDSGLNRLGQGGGHYDRWLADHPDTRTIGLAWSVQEVERVPVEPHDRPLDAIVTERSVIRRRG